MQVLTESLTLRETLPLLVAAQQPKQSRFAFRSPCYFVASIDLAVHIILPEVLEDTLPAVARYLRTTSPRWGRSWRGW